MRASAELPPEGPESNAPYRLSLVEAVDRLQSPATIEELASLHAESCLIVDFDRSPGAASDEAVRRATQALPQLACPALAIAGAPLRGSRRAPCAGFLDRFDVAVERAEDLTPVVAMCHRRPLAALALVQLLRHSEALSIHDGLVAESFVYSTLQAGPEFAAWLAARPSSAPKPPGDGPAVCVSREVESRGRERLRLALNRPRKRNAFSAEMRDALVEGLHVAIADPDIAEIVLEGFGPAFCSGGDLDEFGSLPDPATAHAIRSTRNAARLLAQCSDRATARLHGACVGAGIELAAFAGRVIARADAFFELPEVGLGLVPGAGGTVSLPRRIGRQRTAWMALSGARVDASTALQWGLVDRVLDEQDDWHHERGDSSEGTGGDSR